ncbi:TPA: hypothetical protein DIV55_02640 [Patescibacteria group bacterium]|nr:hypothetical protein [Patescibacteria group bacterium]
MKLLRILLFSLIICFLIIALHHSNLAQAQGNEPTIEPSFRDENTTGVTITYTGLIAQQDYWVCWDNDKQDCDDDAGAGRKKFESGSDKTISVVVCGKGEGNVKEGECGNDDYFLARDDYNVRLYRHQEDGDVCCDNENLIAEAKFDIKHFKFDYEITPPNPKTGEPITVKILETRRPHDDKGRNDYDIFLEKRNGQDIGNEQNCNAVPIGDRGGFDTECTFPGVEVGEYQFDINEYGEDFTYYIVEFTVTDTGGEIGDEHWDPDGKDNIDNGLGAGPPGKNPCAGGTCKTALGNLSTDIGAFSTQFLSIAIGLAGGIALVLMVIGSVRVLMSSGDPKNVGAGRDMIIAAVAGLLFLIFSVLILKFIGLNILGGIV